MGARIAPTLPEPVEATERRRISTLTKSTVLSRQNGRCAHPECSTDLLTFGYEVDHVIPLWMGGADDASNMAALCRPHHRVKTAQDAKARAKAKRRALKHTGQFPPAKVKLRGRGFEKRYSEDLE